MLLRTRQDIAIRRSLTPTPAIDARIGVYDPRYGFSILELMFTLILLALVYAIAVPSVMNARVSASVHNAKYSVVSSVQLARATAIRYGRPAVLRLDASEDRVWVEVDTTVAGAGVMDTLGSIYLADEFNVELRSNRTGLCYNGRGIATTGTACPNAGGVIIVALRSKADTIVVSTVGRVTE